ncbi:MAG: DsrE family protein [Candidatus Marinarcus sp.]|uniref:DsrE family protein n=1 Tax=Candidatus Marinarcus sp. TaxID=3100987 RepID=UPI003B00F727
MKKENLLIVLSSENEEVALKFPLLYGSVVLPREYWKSCHLMFWGPSIKLAAFNEEVRGKIKEMQQTGVTFSACIVCVEDYDTIKELASLGIELNHTGELLTKALKDDSYSVLTI